MTGMREQNGVISFLFICITFILGIDIYQDLFMNDMKTRKLYSTNCQI